MTDPIRCTSCGAVMKPRAEDGRVTECEFCGAQIQATVTPDQIAAGLRLDVNDMQSFLQKLADGLHVHMEDRTRLVREGAHIVLFEINLDPDMFVARKEGVVVVGQYKKLVRGVALKTVTHPLDRWVSMLYQGLAKHANENARVAHALSKIGGGGM
mgnify:CR=1 FL=1